ncbi:sphingosine kinase [Trifolium repens]|nr:sphingosine kinase [Trifolium repens]
MICLCSNFIQNLLTSEAGVAIVSSATLAPRYILKPDTNKGPVYNSPIKVFAFTRITGVRFDSELFVANSINGINCKKIKEYYKDVTIYNFLMTEHETLHSTKTDYTCPIP